MTNNLLRRLIQDSNRTHRPVRVAFNTVVVGVTSSKRVKFDLSTGRNPFRGLRPPFGASKIAGSMLANSTGEVLVLSGKPQDNEGLVIVRLDTPLRADIESVAVPVEAIKLIGEQDNELPSEVPAK